ncbi:MAG TPA: hypothetical protein VN026_01860, partial [Bacteroidia bacterium]|nr:hypothetical protein [Bacteroidia bacterium]
MLGAFKCLAQKNITVTILDSKTKLPVDFAFVSSDDRKLNLVSNKEGQLLLNAGPKIKYYVFYKIGYATQTVPLVTLLQTDTLFLVSKSYNLVEVTITPKLFDTIIRDKRFYVDDYIVLPNYDFLIITSKKSSKEFNIAYYKRYRGITCTKKMMNETHSYLFNDCFKNLHLVTDYYSRQILFDSDSTFDFLPKFNKTKFDSTVALCALKVDTQLVLKSFRPPFKVKKEWSDYSINSPFLTYIRVSKHNRQNLYTAYYTKEMRSRIRNEAGDAYRINGLINDIGGHAMSAQKLESSVALFYRAVAKPIYAPIFLKNDTVIIFNFQENIIVFLTTTGNLLKEVKMNEEEFSTYHDFEVIYDELKQKFYYKTKEADKSTLTFINIYKGGFSPKIKLEKIFAKNIQILNDKAYYLVK